MNAYEARVHADRCRLTVRLAKLHARGAWPNRRLRKRLARLSSEERYIAKSQALDAAREAAREVAAKPALDAYTRLVAQSDQAWAWLHNQEWAHLEGEA